MINIIEVGPRDGFQNLCDYIPLEKKLSIVDKIVESGVKNIQLTSFVSPKAIPQMQDSAELAKICLEKYPEVKFSALVPNLRGAKGALEAGIKNISYVMSLSESHNKKNVNRTHEESLIDLAKIIEECPELNICVDLATTFGCPFEGKKYADETLTVVEKLSKLDFSELDLCDTIGVADPKQVRDTITAVRKNFPKYSLQVHIHDTRNMGMVNTLAAIESGVESVQSTLGGLGGCPFAPGASGNLATEDLVHMLNEMGYDTGINLEKLVSAAKFEKEIIPNGNYSSHSMNL